MKESICEHCGEEVELCKCIKCINCNSADDICDGICYACENDDYINTAGNVGRHE